MSTPDGESLVGQFLGPYRIDSRLGEGGMGEVYRALHVELHRPVAIKTLRPEVAAQPDLVARFFAEAKAANLIRHENIIECTDLVANPGGTSYIVMELLEGRTLSDAIRDSGRIAPERAVFITAQVADALEAAHRKNIIHRDLKPDNVFLIRRLGTDDYVKVLDFGVARLQPDISQVKATQTGAVIGTPAYMSPEQCEGRRVTPAADIYALGIILFQMLTGQLPFDGPTLPMMLVAHLTTEPPRVHSLAPDVPAALSAVVAQCLAKQPQDRPPSMAAMRTTLLEAVGMTGLLPAPAGAMTRPLGPKPAPQRTFDTTPEPRPNTLLHGTPPPPAQDPNATRSLGTPPPPDRNATRSLGTPPPPAQDSNATRSLGTPPPPARGPEPPYAHGTPQRVPPRATIEGTGHGHASAASQPSLGPGRDSSVAPMAGYQQPAPAPYAQPSLASQSYDAFPARGTDDDGLPPVTPSPTLAPVPARAGQTRPAGGSRRRLYAAVAVLVTAAAGAGAAVWVARTPAGLTDVGADAGVLATGSTDAGTGSPEHDLAGLHERLDQISTRQREPAAPAGCRSDDPAVLGRLIEAAALLDGGSPDSGRDQDVKAVRLLLADEPTSAEHWYWLAKARLYAEANVAAVTEAAERALALCSDYAAAHNAIGSALFRDDPAAAAAAYRNALKVAPGYAGARYNLGLVQLEQGQAGEAISALTEVIDRDADHLYPDAFLVRGQAYLMVGRAALAVPDLERVTSADPNNASGFFLLGQAYAAADREADARAAMCRAADLGLDAASAHCRR
ncbi:protein kinase domain-containing protein [Haliangium sp.]|uniref:serine/threonine-protein kinase n=1 Tax=Haliangium sp. TaxID=2663208 RepID=UPI003D0DC916